MFGRSVAPAVRRAVRTAGQTFFGALAGVEVIVSVSFGRQVAAAALSAAIAAGFAFFQNLKDG